MSKTKQTFLRSAITLLFGSFFIFPFFSFKAQAQQNPNPLFQPWAKGADGVSIYLKDKFENVGIGTMNPAAKLHLYDDANGAEGMIETDAIDKYARLILSNPKREFIITNNAVDDLLSFYYGGDNRLQFDTVNQWFNSGNVGIGTTSPQASVHIGGEGRLRIDSGNIERPDGVGVGFNIGNGTNTALGNFQVCNGVSCGAGNYFFVDGSSPTPGNVGIGTTSPRAKLEINSTVAPQLVIDAGVYGQDFSKEAVLQLQAKSPAADNWRNNILTDVNGNLVLRKSFTTATDPTIDALVINSSGNVGIGTTSPRAKLEVAGDLQLSSGGDLRLAPAISGNDALLYSDYGELNFYNNGATRMVLANDGKLGIGKTNPQYPLDVNGAVNIPKGDALRASGNWLIGQSADANNTIAIGSLSIANNIELDSNGSARLFVSGTTGNVGVGTTSPTGKLAVNVNDQTDGIDIVGNYAPALRIGDVNSGTYGKITYFYDPTLGNRMMLGTPGAVVHITSSGVGINNIPEDRYSLDVGGGLIRSGSLCLGTDCRSAWPTSSGESVWGKSGSDIYYSAGNVGIGIVPQGIASLEIASSTDDGIRATSSGGAGVFGESTTSTYAGIQGYNEFGPAVKGYSDNGYGVHGVSVNSSAGYFTSSNGYGVYANSGNNFAGYFEGDVKMTKNLHLDGDIVPAGDICIGKCS